MGTNRAQAKVKGLSFLLAALVGLVAPLQGTSEENAEMRFSRATAWLNSTPPNAGELRGKVVLVDFWTYTCINWLRTAPYIRAWDAKYKDQGLVVVGVHTPEFEFEKDVSNVRRAVQDMQITYPVAIDSNYGVWRAFRNNAWPAVYLVDAQGRVRYSHLGEEEYERTERMIQQLLAENGRSPGKELIAVAGKGAEAPPDWASLRSPETYLGQERGQNRMRGAPSRLRLNHWTAIGDWSTKSDSIALRKPTGRIAYRFHARDLHLVMGPSPARSPVRFRVLLDGKPPGLSHGTDIDERGIGVVKDQRLYQLIRQQKPIEDRTFEIEFLDDSLEAFAFTFG